MVGKGLTESEVPEIVYESDESFSDSSNDIVGSSGNETDDVGCSGLSYTWCVSKVSVLIFYLIICWTYLKLQVISFEV